MAHKLLRGAIAVFLVLSAAAPATVLADPASGQTLGWGANDAAQLGAGPGPASLSPGVLSSVSHIQAIAAGANHTVALLDDGTVWAWGRNDRGQLGFAPPAPDELGESTGVPVQVPYLSGIVAVAAGNNHSLALDSGGTVWAWGDNGWGQIGNGHPNPDDFDAGGYSDPRGGALYSYMEAVPVAVAGLSGVTAIAAGGNHSLALLWDGTVREWGMDPTAFGAGWINPIGAPLLTGVVPLPLPVELHGFDSVGPLSDVRAIAAGGGHNLALTGDGSVYAWGANESGQLGEVLDDPGCPCRYSAARIPGLFDVRAIAAGQRHSLALSHETVFAWGANDRGQLGNGTLADTSRPSAVSGLPSAGDIGGGFGSTVPIALAAGLNDSFALVNAVVESPSMHCGTFGEKCQHMLYAWGANDAGQLGDGSTSDALTAELIAHVRGVRQAAAGERHTLALDGEIFNLPIFATDPTSAPEIAASGPVPQPIDAVSKPSSGTTMSLEVPTRTPTPAAPPTRTPTPTPVAHPDVAPSATPTTPPLAVPPTPPGATSSPTPAPTQIAAVPTSTPTRTATATPTQSTILIVIPSATPMPTLNPIR